MSTIEPSVASGEESQPGIEPWLVVCLLAFVPGALIVILPRATLAPLLLPIGASMIALLVAGLAMLWRAEWTRRRRDARSRDDARATIDGRQLQ